MSKGLHRALVPVESQMGRRTSSLESEEYSPGYRMLTQTDVIRFLHSKSEVLQPILSQNIEALGAVQTHVYGVPANMTLVDTMKCMTQASLSAVAILDYSLGGVDEDMAESEQVQQLVLARGKRILGTFSASDLRGCSVESFQKWAREGILRFLARATAARHFGVAGSALGASRELSQDEVDQLQRQIPLLTCYSNSALEYVIMKALEWRVHRVWVVEEQNGLLAGVVSFSDILRVIKQYAESAGHCN
ncbi:hypothetical protein KP509_06G023200 [Ceratopteris richardii]|nr:hypothetical protein KP509_06G023200 [Ceratopteris richardii]